MISAYHSLSYIDQLVELSPDSVPIQIGLIKFIYNRYSIRNLQGNLRKVKFLTVWGLA